MKTKHLFLTALAVLALVTASFSNIFSSDDNVTLKCYNNRSYCTPEDTTGNGNGNGDGNGGGTIIYPIGN
jgi:hypothetical protein